MLNENLTGAKTIPLKKRYRKRDRQDFQNKALLLNKSNYPFTFKINVIISNGYHEIRRIKNEFSRLRQCHSRWIRMLEC